jgi:hypothetical protein
MFIQYILIKIKNKYFSGLFLSDKNNEILTFK